MRNIPLTLSNLESLIGKTIIWEAEAYKGNKGYHGYGCYGGKERITEIDITKRSPIVSSEKIDPESDGLTFAFVDDHSLIAASENSFINLKADGKNNCLSYTDRDREIFFEICDEN